MISNYSTFSVAYFGYNSICYPYSMLFMSFDIIFYAISTLNEGFV